VPGRRIKLHSRNINYSLGGNRGGIDERWFFNQLAAQMAHLTPKNEGLTISLLKMGVKPNSFY